MSDHECEATDYLRRHGHVRCDIAACNCGSWHHRFGLPERWQEIKDALSDAGHPLCNENGHIALRAFGSLVAERDALRAALVEAVDYLDWGGSLNSIGAESALHKRMRAAVTEHTAVQPRARLPDAPCPHCGYNGPGYYQSDTHPCATDQTSTAQLICSHCGKVPDARHARFGCATDQTSEAPPIGYARCTACGVAFTGEHACTR